MTGFRAEAGLALAAVLFIGTASGANGSPIEVNSLGSPDGPAAGLLDATNGGMDANIWAGSSRATIEDMLTRLPLATPVRSVRALARKLVLTTADAPVGQASHAFQTVRIVALLNAGLVVEAAKLAAQVQLKDDPEFARAQAEAILLGGDTPDACGNATIARQTEPEPFWLKLRAYCYAVAGQDDFLELTRGVMKAQNADDKPFEILLDDALAHKSTPPGEMRNPTAVEMFLLRQAGLPINPSLAARFGVAVSVLALRDAKDPPAARADAATQALHTGSISSAELAAVADALPFTRQQLANAGTAAVGLPFFQGQALIRQAVAHAHTDDAKAALLAVAFRLGRDMQLLPVAAGMQQKAAAAILPTPPLRAYAPAFAQALLLVRQADAAERWREILDPNSNADASLAANLAIALNLIAPNPDRGARAQAALAWLASNSVAPQPAGGAEEQRYGALAVGLTDALGETTPPGISAATLLAEQWTGGVVPPAARKRLGTLQGQPGCKGEAVLTILDAVGPEGPGDLTPDSAAFLVHSLMVEGESDAARSLAIDALLLFQRPPP